MKKFLLSCCLAVLFCFFAKSAIITWDGQAGDGLWATPANWVGDIAPGTSDDVRLDNSVVAGSYTVTLPAGTVSVSVISLIITPASSNSITLILPNTNTAAPAFSITGTGDALVLNSGSIFKNSSGASSGEPLVITNRFRINNGARYIHNTLRANAAIVSQLSTASGTETGEFEYDRPATSSVAISASGRTYGTLILSSAASGGVATYTCTGGNPLNINGDLIINTSVTFNTSMTGDIIIHRHLIQSASSVFSLQTAANNNLIKVQGNITSQGTITETGTGLPVLELNGAANQNITIAGAIQNSVTLRVNNAAGITLLSPITLPYQLDLTNGKIKTDATNVLTLADNAVYTGGSPASFIEGPVKKTGDEDFNFPVGVGTIYAPIGILGAGGNTTDQFTAEYKRQNPQSTPGLGNNVENPIDHISTVEYWEITRNMGTSVKTIQFTVTEFSFAKVLNTLLAARFENGQWQNDGGNSFIAGPDAPPYITGTFESTDVAANFGAFTIATTDDEMVNPLPIHLISFSVVKLTNEKATLNWVLAEYGLPEQKFEIEKATGDQTFETIGIVNASETSRNYEYSDNHLTPGTTYYRLKMIDTDGVITYSPVATILNEAKQTLLGLLAPTIVTNTAVLTIAADSDQQLDLIISDMQGRIVKRQHHSIPAGNTYINLWLNDLGRGVYQIYLTTHKGIRNTIRFIKQ